MELLQHLSQHGVSVWLDDLSRSLLRSGRLAELIGTRSVVGLTSNPTIFATAVQDGQAYDNQVRDLAVRGVSVAEAVRTLTCTDVREACDVLQPVCDGPTASTAGCRWRSTRGSPTTPTGPWPKPGRWPGSSTDRT